MAKFCPIWSHCSGRKLKIDRVSQAVQGIKRIEMEQHVFAFSLIIEGTTEKMLQFIMPLKTINNQNFGFIEQKKIFSNTTESFKQ